MTRRQALTDAVLALLLTVFAGVAGQYLVFLLFPTFTPPLLVLAAFQGLIVLAGLALLIRWRGESWRALGLVRLQLRDIGRTVIALLVILVANTVFILSMYRGSPEAAEEHSQQLLGVAGLLAGNLPFVLVLAGVLFIGLYEELLARGLLLQRCLRFTGSVWAAVLLSSLLFGLGHFYQGWAGVAQTALIGVILARLTLYWGTLWPAIAAHALINGWTLGLARLLERGVPMPF